MNDRPRDMPAALIDAVILNNRGKTVRTEGQHYRNKLRLFNLFLADTFPNLDRKSTVYRRMKKAFYAGYAGGVTARNDDLARKIAEKNT